MTKKRVLFILILATVNIVASWDFIPYMFWFEAGIYQRNRRIIGSFGTLLSLFATDLAVLWILSRIGGPLKAEVKASIKKFGGSIWITAAGLVGCFLAIAIVSVAALYFLASHLPW